LLSQKSARKPKSKTEFTKKMTKTLIDNQEFKNFLTKLEKVKNNAVIFKVVGPFNT